jgi:hypothetical protein
MATNTLAPFGLVYSRNLLGSAPTYQGQEFKIKNGYGSKISVGDVVITGTSGQQGYVNIAAANPTGMLGVFNGVLPYYDTALQGTAHGLNGSYATSASPPSGVDIPCLVYVDPYAVYRVQASGGPFTVSMRGQNVNWTTGTNGTPNAAGISVLSVDLSTVATTSTLPFRIVGIVGVTGGPNDPANTNPTIEVMLNFGLSEFMNATGI